ncbi:MAG: insulinase family protein [Acidobacteria bacterium]|nr:insulinase family protein [Acidobacteriota bacterium]
MRRVGAVLCLALGLWANPWGSVTQAGAQQLEVEEFVLENGMTFLLVPRKGDPAVSAGWVAKVGSVNERPGITGISHLFEHMMFKGTRTIGTTNIEQDLAVMARMDAVKSRIVTEELAQQQKLRLGEITDIADPKQRTPRHQQLLDELADLEKQAKALIVANEFDKIYTAAGASSMNATTSQDLTLYFINVPSNKLELWFWMESDRLRHPVFREFYTERDVVAEERRLRIDSTPTGKLDEQFDAIFWNASPYHWPVVGWPSDLHAITREEAQAYYDLNYAPNNLAACLVGDFDPRQVKALAQQYFGRLPRNPRDPLPVRTTEVEPLGERRFIASADTSPEVELRYLTVADGHVDEFALVVAGALLNGRTGRLYKSLVLGQQVASNAGAGQNGLKWQGYFSFSGTARAGKTPEDVEAALEQEIRKLQDEVVDERELQKVKNIFEAGNYRRLQSNLALMFQLLAAEAGRGWQAFNDDPKRLAAVTPADIQRVAKTYFVPERRAVATYYTKKKADGQPSDDLMAGLTDEQREKATQMRAMVAQMPIDQARQLLARVTQQEAAAPPEMKPLVTVMKTLLEQRIAKGGQL